MGKQSAFSAVRVGAAQVDITPKADTHLAGAIGLYRPARMVRDPLYAKAVVVERECNEVTSGVAFADCNAMGGLRQPDDLDVGVDLPGCVGHTPHYLPRQGNPQEARRKGAVRVNRPLGLTKNR